MTENTSANSPKVSIVTTTHNQEAYVRQAFDSFVAQQTDFPVEIVVADDASTDATPSRRSKLARSGSSCVRSVP